MELRLHVQILIIPIFPGWACDVGIIILALTFKTEFNKKQKPNLHWSTFIDEQENTSNSIW